MQRCSSPTRVAILAIVVSMVGALTAQQAPRELFERARILEEGNQNLSEAIDLYGQVIAQAAGDRALAATALFRQGVCYEKLGMAEARQAYDRVVHEYSDQRDLVAQARTRLAALTVPPTLARAGSPTLRELKIQAYNAGFSLSPDGTMIAYQGKNEHLVVRDLASGAEREFGLGWRPVWSPDGKRIAFSHQENYWNYEIRILSVETGQEQHREVNGLPVDWSSDGRFILYVDPFRNLPTLNLLPVDGGMPQRIAIDWNGLDSWVYRFSPDGRYITYSSRKNGNADIYLLPINGGPPARVTDHPARDFEPLWTADGRLLLFLSDRVSGRIDLWGVRMLAGKPAGDPFVVRPDVGELRLSSLSNSGRLLYWREREESWIYVTPIDPVTYQPVGQGVKLGSRSLTGFPQPTWSPDGQRIAYLDTTGNMPALRVMAADGTEDREIAAGPFNIGPFAWCSDDHIYLQGASPATGRAIYVLSVSTKELKVAFLDQEILGHVACAPDGSRLAFLRGLRHRQVYTADVDGKNLRQATFVDEDTTVAYPAWSPDGSEIAFSFGKNGDRRGVMVVSLKNGATRQVVSIADPENRLENRFYDSSWSPDSKRIAWFSRVGANAGDSLGFEIRTAPVSGDGSFQPFRVDLGASVWTSTAQPRWSPDGKKMLFAAGHYVYQILLMDNFLREADTKAGPDGQGPSR